VFSSQVKLKTVTQKAACRMANRVIANSSAVRSWLLSLGIKEDHIDVIPNGIALAERPLPSRDLPIRRELGIDLAAPVVAVVSRLNPGKGVEYFLRAATTVSQRCPAARFLIVGESYFNRSYRPELEKLAQELGLAANVIFTGERTDVPALLQEVNVSVLPSLSEGLSNSLLEAMAARLPVIATNVGGNPEIVRDGTTGFLVPSQDPEALSNAIIRVLESPDLADRLGEAGYNRVAAQFSLKSTVQKTEDLYTALLEERHWRNARASRAS
jgi:glycosyltransferase involved in cell wall biosynthesis